MIHDLRKKNQRLLLVIPLLLSSLVFSTISWSKGHYFVCGPDEDGCFEDIYEYCACIPENKKHKNEAFCLTDDITCIPLSEAKNCPHYAVFDDQATCLAVKFHSIPDQPCLRHSKHYCKTNHIPLCKMDGNIFSCKPWV